METQPRVTDSRRLRLLRLTEQPHRKEQWDRYVFSHPLGSVFHLVAWQNVISSTFGHQAEHLVAEDQETGNLVGVLPLFLSRSIIFGRMLISTPQAAYGGILASSREAEDALLREARSLARVSRVKFLELRNFQNRINDDRLVAKDLYVTFRQELFDDPEKNLQLIPRKTRAEVREGIRNGLEFRVDAIDVNQFYEVYSRSVRALGTPVFPRKLFLQGLREFGKDCKIFSVHWKESLVSAVWTLFYRNEVVPYYGGSLREYNHLAVNNFMYWMLIKYGCENGYGTFDFGRSKKGTGSYNFKKRWGMVMTDLPYQYHFERISKMPDTSPLNPKFAMGINVWRRLPLFVTNALGPIITRHLT